jgi:hypothetical protein
MSQSDADDPVQYVMVFVVWVLQNSGTYQSIIFLSLSRKGLPVTPHIAKIYWVKNVRAFVVKGFLIE